MTLDGLSEWPSVLGIRTEPVSDQGAFTAHIGPPERIAVRLSSGVDFRLVVYNDAVCHLRPAGLRVVQKTHIELRAPSPLPLPEFKTLIARLQRFFSLAVDRTLHVESIKGSSTELAREGPNGDASQVPIGIYYGDFPRSRSENQARSREALLRYQDFAQEPERFLSLWSENYNNYEPAFDLYFDVAFGAASTPENRFLMLATAIEVLHGRKYGGRKETRLFDRILKMVKPFRTLFGRRRHQRNEFAEVAWHSRNNLLHHEPQTWVKAVSGRELWALSLKLEALCQLCLLRCTGMADDALVEVAKASNTLRHKLGL